MRMWVRLLQVLVISVMIIPLASPAVAQEEEMLREETAIFDVDGSNPITNFQLFNPYVIGVPLNHGAHQAMWEPLFLLNWVTGELDMWLAESVEANDALDVWTVKIREGVKWADGEDFNADDLVFTLNMLKDNAPELWDSATFAEWVDSVEKIDDLTVQINLTKPNPRFAMDYLGVKIWREFHVLPEHVWKDQDPLTFTFYDPEKGWPFATGAYLPVDIGEDEMVWKRRDDWWGAQTGFRELPKPKWLIWRVHTTEEIRVAAAAVDELDVLTDITFGAFQALIAQNPNWKGFTDTNPAWHPDPCPRLITINNTVAPWDDPEMRWALSYLVDRAEVVTIAYEGTTIPSRAILVEYPRLSAINDKLEAKGLTANIYDPEKAAVIFESKGYAKNADGYWEKDGEVLSITVDSHDGFIELRRMAQIVVEQWQRGGVDARQRVLAGSTWGDNIAFGNFEAVSDWHACASITEPWATMNIDTQKYLMPVGERASGNTMRWSGPNAEAYSTLVDEMGVLPLGDPKIEELALEAMEYWFKDLPFLPITQSRKIVPANYTYWVNWPTIDNHYTYPCTWCANGILIVHNIQPASGE